MDAEIEKMSAEQAADLARLEGMAADGQPGPEQGPEQGPPQADHVESLAGLITIGGMVAGGLGYRRVSELWQPDTCRGLAEKVVPVLEKYPWGARVLGFLETGAGVEEVALAMYAAPLAYATIQAARADDAERAARRRQAREPEQAVETIDAAPAQAQDNPGAGMEWAA
jgi:hypothetical protein